MIGEGGSDLSVSRRNFAAATVLAMTSTAGCSELAKQSFEATPIILPAESRDRLQLAETTREAVTVDFDGPSVSEVEITNHTAVYNRADGFGGA